MWFSTTCGICRVPNAELLYLAWTVHAWGRATGGRELIDWRDGHFAIASAPKYTLFSPTQLLDSRYGAFMRTRSILPVAATLLPPGDLLRLIHNRP
jgi:hypothetical protein